MSGQEVAARPFKLPQSVLVVVHTPALDILLIQRAERSGDPWSGHMALPGGRHSAADATLLETAMREAAEEIGIHLDPGQLVGTLDDVAPRTPVLPPIVVRPHVFALEPDVKFALSDEVAAAFWAPLGELRAADATFEAGLKERIVVSEFPDLETAIRAHNGPEYAEALKALGDGAVRDVRIIQGLE